MGVVTTQGLEGLRKFMVSASTYCLSLYKLLRFDFQYKQYFNLHTKFVLGRDHSILCNDGQISSLYFLNVFFYSTLFFYCSNLPERVR